ncbi:putative cytochrome P450 superfamily protein isoform X4 [Iris pallida]|uniref:Cytochrome P450 superfamily protein isoform X4 n=1 Tax=Iris pallida TaxID=29817 RepID=A0AAX6G732_IRIPA|nr:putative cytochrome P450 superfamily protein isoform X4 [Iris pallida]
MWHGWVDVGAGADLEDGAIRRMAVRCARPSDLSGGRGGTALDVGQQLWEDARVLCSSARARRLAATAADWGQHVLGAGRRRRRAGVRLRRLVRGGSRGSSA